MPEPRNPSQPRLTFRNGGWVLALAAIMCTGIVGWRLAAMIHSRGTRPVGDGRDPASYGFDLSNCRVPIESITAAGVPKDGVPAMTDPAVLPGTDVVEINRREHGKFLVSADRVIGVTIGGQSRAYPLRVLNWHEVVNDTLAGVPIVVTYSPLCDAAVVFDRRVEGETLTFGVSGLFSNGDLLLYDRRPTSRDESLWLQLRFEAVAGPAAGRRLTIVPASLVHWADWLAQHPNTTVLARDPKRLPMYKEDPYSSYFGSDELRCPVSPLPPDNGMPKKAPVMAVRVHERWTVFPLSAIAGHVDAAGQWQTTLDGVGVRFDYRDDPPVCAVTATAPGSSVEAVYCCWFAWYAQHPDAAALAR